MPFLDVSVIPTTRLPEQVLRPRAPLTCQLGKPLRGLFPEPGQSLPCDRLLELAADHGHVVSRTSGMDDQVHMVRHEDPGPDIELKTPSSSFDRLHKPFADPVSREERISSVTGERQFVSVSRFIRVPAMTPRLTRAWGHDASPIGHAQSAKAHVPIIDTSARPSHPAALEFYSNATSVMRWRK